MLKSTINLSEISKFGKLASSWWNEKANEAKMLHKMNPLRLEYILNHTDLKNKKVLEVGCGGGILSMPLARLGAKLTSIEPSAELYDVAIKKAEEESLDINFLNIPIENMQDNDFDVILIMDVLEHVENQIDFLKQAESLLKKDGILIISTINKTMLSKIFVKFIAEDIARIIPKGTHEFEKFISPREVCKVLDLCKKIDLSGFLYNPILDKFKLQQNAEMNYFLTLTKER